MVRLTFTTVDNNVEERSKTAKVLFFWVYPILSWIGFLLCAYFDIDSTAVLDFLLNHCGNPIAVAVGLIWTAGGLLGLFLAICLLGAAAWYVFNRTTQGRY